MKNLLPVFLLIFSVFSLRGQIPGEAPEGTISYITSQNVYVKFQSTAGISIGDTLFWPEDTKLVPVLVVKDLSSISCVCTPITTMQLAVNDKIISLRKTIKLAEKNEIAVEPKPKTVEIKQDTVSTSNNIPALPTQNISGRISLASYSNFSNVSDFSQRMRYTFSLNAQNIGDSKLSGETYISFVHKLKEWGEVKNDIFNGLKIYSLAFNYAFNRNNNVWIGRKINPRLSNVGAVDGIQLETKLKSLTAGIVAGTRPDYLNYSFNAKLLQYGGYFGHDFTNKKGGIMQSSVAFMEQTNNGNTDRRFVYLQHSNSLMPNLYFFGSMEFDLYNKALNVQDSSYTQDNTPNLSNLYVSLRYKVLKQLSVSLSYSERQNIIYYETYKTIVDQLLEAATMKGYMFQVTVRPTKYLSIGANAGYRFSKPDPKATKNLYTYLTYSNLPWINASATVSASLLETAYLSGSIYSAGFSRDLIPGKLYGGLNYRYVNYKFLYNDTPLVQQIAEMNLTWRMLKKLSCSMNYEGTFEKGRNYDRIYVNVTQRF